MFLLAFGAKAIKVTLEARQLEQQLLRFRRVLVANHLVKKDVWHIVVFDASDWKMLVAILADARVEISLRLSARLIHFRRRLPTDLIDHHIGRHVIIGCELRQC